MFSFDAPDGLYPVSAGMSASAQRAVLKIEMGEGPGHVDAVQIFGGPVNGGWSELQPFTRLRGRNVLVALQRQADGVRIFSTESRGDTVRVVVRDPEPHEVAFAKTGSASRRTSGSRCPSARLTRHAAAASRHLRIRRAFPSASTSARCAGRPCRAPRVGCSAS